MKEHLHLNSLSIRILGTVIGGILLVCMAVSLIIIHISKNIFVDTYGESQEKVFLQIENDLNDFHEDLMGIVSAIHSSWAFRLYLGEEDLEAPLAFQTIFQMQKELNQAIPANIDNISVMVVSLGGKTFINREETITSSPHDILESEITKNALAHPETIQYQYAPRGFTATTKSSKVLIATRALTYQESKEAYAVIYITMKEKDVEIFYHYFTSNATDFYLMDQNETIVSSNQKTMIGQKGGRVLSGMWERRNEMPLRSIDDQKQQITTILHQKLPYLNYEAFGVIDNNRVLKDVYNIPQLVGICSIIGLAALLAAFLSVRQTTQPLLGLIRKMARVRAGNFKEYMEVKGSEEVMELAITYNYMLDDLNQYIEKLLHTQKEKRKAEISALQMQINPHYIYNTLTSIKWLVLQGDKEKSTKTMDAFINLLRNTISNTDEFITIRQEIDNLKNYVFINNTRYGNQIQVEFFAAESSVECLLPKLILQPFIENAFFHAFPSDQYGMIQVMIGCKNEVLKIEIIDDGIGMSESCLNDMKARKSKSEHFTGIGINNVDDRLKLIYGEDYGVRIRSRENEGTIILITLPAKPNLKNTAPIDGIDKTEQD